MKAVSIECVQFADSKIVKNNFENVVKYKFTCFEKIWQHSDFKRLILQLQIFFIMTPFRNLFLTSIVFCLFFFSCKNKDTVRLPETKAAFEKTNLEIHRYEQALFSIDPNNLAKGLEQLQPQFGVFFNPGWNDTLNLLRLKDFITDPEIGAVYRLTQKEFKDISPLKTELEKAFSQLRMYEPNFTIPVVYTYISGLDIETPVIYGDSAMAIGLDLFLGKDAEPYKHSDIPLYKVQRLTPQHLPAACMMAVSESMVKIDESKFELLNEMIYAGKQLYFLDVTLPQTPDYIKIGYSEQQLDWCKENEGNIWGYFIENQILYSPSKDFYKKFIIDAPFTSGLPKESPGRLGAWVGWQIVRAYMKKQPDQTLDALMQNTDFQEILQVSKYKPKK